MENISNVRCSFSWLNKTLKWYAITTLISVDMKYGSLQNSICYTYNNLRTYKILKHVTYFGPYSIGLQLVMFMSNAA